MQEADRTGTFSGRVIVMFGAQVFGAAVGIVNGILLARLLGPAGKGDYYIIVLLPATVVVLLQLGLPQAIEFFSAQGKTFGLVAKSFVLTGVLSAIGFALVLILLPVLQEAILHGIDPQLVLLALLALPLALHAFFSASIVIGRQAVHLYAAVKISYPLVWTVLIVAIFAGLGPSVAAAIAVYVIVAVINALGLLVAAVRVSRAAPLPGVASYRQLIRFGLRFYPASLAAFFSYRVDAYLLAFLISNPSEPLGYYSLAVGLAEMVFFFPSAVAAVFFPHVAGSSREESDRQVALVSRVTLLVSGMFALLLIPAASVMIWTVLPAFEQSFPPLLVLLPGVVALSGANVVGGYLTGIGRPGFNSIVTVIALLVNMVANLVLIPRFGILGAASASLISYSLSSVLLTAVAARISGTPMRRFWIPGPDDVRYVAATSAGLVRRIRNGIRGNA
jgi:O-antigen/teichoic acid export membrane protein